MRRVQLEAALAVVQRVGFLARDIGLLDSALERPVTRVYCEYVYPSLALARNYSLIDSNKRIALILLNALLRVNGCKHTMPIQVSFEFIMRVAQGKISIEESAKILEKYIVPW